MAAFSSTGFHVARFMEKYPLTVQDEDAVCAAKESLSHVIEKCAKRGITLSCSFRVGEPTLLSPRAKGEDKALMYDVEVFVSLSSKKDESFSQEKASAIWKELNDEVTS